MVNHAIKLALIVTVALFLAISGGDIEGRFAPVVSRVEITRMEPLENGYTRIWGHFSLDRPACDFVGLEWTLRGVTRNVGADLVFEEGTKERGGGVQEFGPWRVQLDQEQITERSWAIVYHQCPWRWWRTETEFFP